MAATHRAVYQVLEHGHIFSDPLAVAMLGVDQDETDGQARETPSSRRMRLFISIRTRFAEHALAAAYQQGVRQLLVLGAGLDLYGSKRTVPDGLRVFEVDRRQEPRAMSAIAVELAAAGFDRNQRTLVTWLGVVPYLTEDAIWSTLKFLAEVPGGIELVFDYSNPPHTLSPERHRPHEQLTSPPADIASNEAHGLSHFDTAELHERLRELGFVHVDDMGPVDIAQRYLPDVTAHVAGTGAHIVRIATV